MSGPADVNGLPDELGPPLDMLLHRGEANPRTRSGIMALEILDRTPPDWNRFRTAFENASRKVLRLRQRVVVPTLPTAAPRWVVDPRLQSRLPRPPGSGPPRAGHSARGTRPRRGEPAVAAGHLPPIVDGHPGRRLESGKPPHCCTSVMRSPTESAPPRCSPKSMTSNASRRPPGPRRPPFQCRRT